MNTSSRKSRMPDRMRDNRTRWTGFAGDLDRTRWTGFAWGLALAGAALAGTPYAAGQTRIGPIAPPGAVPQPSIYAGQVFRDCPGCPEMVVVPAGSFVMGSPPGERGAEAAERPYHPVTFLRPFAVGRHEVTFAEWDACVAEGGCDRYRPRDEGWGRGRRPVIDVRWDDARNYVFWLSLKTGQSYRLLSEAEWEYAARGGTQTPYPWGEDFNPRESPICAYANVGTSVYGCSRGQPDRTVPVGSLRANGFGLHDMIGNVLEWTEDCWNDDYRAAPADGRASQFGDCRRRVLRGGSFDGHYPPGFRSAARRAERSRLARPFIGFRVARSLF